MKKCACLAGILTLLVTVLAAGACSNNTTTPAPSTTTTTDTFNGTLNQNGASTFTYSISGAGSVTATITALGVPQVVGILVGAYNSTTGTCSSVLSNDFAQQGTVLKASSSAAVTGCVRIYDALGSVATTTFTITVEHP